MSVRYIDMDDVRLYGFQFKEENDAAVFEKIIPRASAIFDSLCGVSAGYFRAADPEAVATEKTVYGSGGMFLTVPPHVGALVEVKMPAGHTLPGYVENDGALFTADSSGVMTAAGGDLIWPAGVAVTIKAKWGLAETPDDVKEAVVELAVAIWRSKDTAFLKQINIADHTVVNEAVPRRTRMIAAVYRTPALGSAFV